MILLRHGQSQFNLHYDHSAQDPGIVDAPLTLLGHEQAERAARYLESAGIKRILSSPYTRALQTAAPVAKRLNLPVLVTPVIRERRTASCDIGTCRTDLAATWPHLDLGSIQEVWWHPHEEPREDFSRRVARFVADMAAAPTWSETLVICHWGVIMAITGQSVQNGAWLRVPLP